MLKNDSLGVFFYSLIFIYNTKLQKTLFVRTRERVDLLRKDFRSEIFRFRARRRKNYEAYTPYMLNNFIRWRSQNLEIAAEKSLRSRSNNKTDLLFGWSVFLCASDDADARTVFF